MEIRLFTKNDSLQVKELFGDTVKLLNRGGSSNPQLHNWSQKHTSFQNWEHQFLNEFTIVAEIHSSIIGLGQMGKTGHINLFFIHPEYRRKGIGRELYSAIEGYAFSRDFPTLFTEASQENCGFFLSLGFERITKQIVLVGGREITSFIMQKPLNNRLS